MFKESFKYYKSKKPEPKLHDVFDLYSNVQELKISGKIKKYSFKETTETLGLKPSTTWEGCEFLEHPGLIYIKNPFTAIGQKYWIIRCLRDYSKKENRRNIDPFNIIPNNEEWWDVAQYNKDVLKKLRWATLGYHHDWDTKMYSEDNRGDFPNDLNVITRTIANSVGYSYYNSEAAIINYYHMDSTLSGHTDHSEQNLEAPLFSFSFGQTAIFLLGGKTLEEKPMALFLKSGDVVVMSSESRLAYHGVPKILKADERSWNKSEEADKCISTTEVFEICTDEEKWKPFGSYLQHSRININVRQVLNRDQKRLNTVKSDA